ncbi:MAG: hypothetical protein KGI70_03080 [Patescibacteria group bacterium]|nr:hypothetical protein [Patescibacteria group bacterium]
MLFGRSKTGDKTYLLVDVESGSVAGALVRLSGNEQPKLFGETRVHLPVLHTYDSGSLIEHIARAAREVVQKVSHVAARVRMHETTADMGRVERAAAFLHAPWGRPNLATGSPDFVEPVVTLLRTTIEMHFGPIPVTPLTAMGGFHRASRAAVPERDYLLASITGEVLELLLVRGGAVVGHATAPIGTNHALRTLRAHAGAHPAEARSLMRAGTHPQFDEALAASGEHFADMFADAAEDLLKRGTTSKVYVLAQEGMGRWYAHALSQSERVGALFQGGVVRDIRAQSLLPHMAAHAEVPDTHLLLWALGTPHTVQ